MYRKNTAGQFICVQLLLTASGAVATGLTPAARRCIDGTFAAGGGTFTEDGATGSYKYALAQADTNGNDISIIVTATGAMPVCVNFVTTAADPTNAATFGITDIDATISSRMATYTQPTGFLAATFPSGTVANQTNITGGTITTVTAVTNQLTAAAIATGIWQDTTAGDFTTALSVGKSVMNGVSLGTGLTIAAVSGAVGSVTGAVGSVTGNVGGNVTGSVGSVVAAVAVTSNIKKNAALANFPFEMLNTAGTAPATGLTVTATRKIDAGAFGACANAVTEIANGWYTIDLAAADLNGNVIAFRMSATGGSDNDFTVITQP